MSIRRDASAILWLLLLACVCARGQETEIPRLAHRVTDLSGTLSASEIAVLEGKLGEFERATSTQIVVVLISDLGGGSIEDISIRMVEKNLIGQKAKDNGVLLLIAKNDRQMRIEVGYGLEGVLTDALSGQIIRNEIVPHFRRGRFYEGVEAGIEAIMQATRNEYQGDAGEDKGSKGLNPLVILFLLLLFGFLRASGMRRRGMGGIFHGGFPGSGGFGGGFRGGGGSFGGGGASGRW